MYRDEGKSRPKLRCPCCRKLVRLIKKAYAEKIFRCVKCKWKSKSIKMNFNVIQADLDKMHMNEKDIRKKVK